MSKVYVIQNTPGKNFEPAKEFGELTIILHGSETPNDAKLKLERALRNFESGDKILLVGNPLFIAMAGIIVYDISSSYEINFLCWDKEHYKYNLVIVDMQP